VELGVSSGGILNSIGGGMLNHQTSKISAILFWFQISLWVLKFGGLNVELGF
jgi:hypothetical protein